MDKVYLVQKICDNEYFCRETVYASASYEGAEEWIKKQSDDTQFIGWNGEIYNMYIIEFWVINP